MVILVVFAIKLGLVAGETTGRGVPDITPQGFTGDVSQRPAVGTWRAVGTYTESKGYNGRVVGEQIVRTWTTARDCKSGTCSYSITRELEGLPATTAPLTPRQDGWYAQFPELLLTCGPGQTWAQRDTFVFRFTAGGRRLQANEVRSSYASACGYGVARVEWTGQIASGERDAPAVAAPATATQQPARLSPAERMAASVKLAVRRDIRRIALRISGARGRQVTLLRAFYATCSVPRGTRAFPCRVNVQADGTASPMFTLRLLVTKTGGRCWRATNDTFIEPGSGVFHYPDSKLQRKLAKPLRGCV